MDDNLFLTVCEETFDLGGLINFDISDQIFVFQVPNLELLRSMDNHEMRSRRDLEYLIAEHCGIGADGEQILGGLNPMKRNSLLIAISNTSIPIIILQVLNNKFLPNINNPIVILIH